MRAWGPGTLFLAGMPCGGLRAAGMVGGRSGGWPSTVVRGVLCQALSLSRLPVSGGRQPGPVARVSRARVVLVWGTQHRPHSAHSCELVLRAVGSAGGRPRGGCLAPLQGASEVRHWSSSGCLSSGRAARVRHPLAVGADVRAWGPSTVPLGRREGVPWGGALAVVRGA